MNESNARQQIVEKLKASSNILVTVNSSPTVDELSAALGLTLLINKMHKHATAVFSGAIPPAITFLDPEKTFEATVDSLRDFIIALDKEKADHLRYKVEGDVVKIFITPYRTTITDKDLDFSQGDYNVEMVIAVGVRVDEDLDKALAAHGKILHDATVATISLGKEKSNLGSIDWRDETASSYSEMLVTLGEALKDGKALIDEQIATAFLTGIVEATERFSNNKTSSRVMTMAAQLMAAGANQQLIASKLEEADELPKSTDSSSPASADASTELKEGELAKVDGEEAPKEAAETNDQSAAGELQVSHELKGSVEEVAEATMTQQQADATKAAEDQLAAKAKEVVAANQEDAAREAERKLSDHLASAPVAASALSVEDLKKDLAAATHDIDEAVEEVNEPSLGGTLNATTEQAAEDKRRELESDRNKTLLSHSHTPMHGEYINEKPTYQNPINASMMPANEPTVKDILSEAPASSGGAPDFSLSAPTVPVAPVQPADTTTSVPSFPAPPQPVQASADEPTLAEIDAKHREKQHDEARDAISAALQNSPELSASTPAPAPVQMSDPASALPPLPDFSTLPPMPPEPGVSSDTNLPPLPPAEKLGDTLPPAPTATAPSTFDPSQFKIPGQS